MELGLINSAWSQAGRGTRYGIEQSKRIGFDTIDVLADPLDIDEEERRLIKEAADDVGLPIRSAACVAVGLMDFNPSVQRFHVERCKAHAEMAKEFGCSNLLLANGEYIWQQEVIPPAEQWSTCVRNTREVGAYAGELGLEVVVELEPFKLSMVNTVETMLRFLDDVDLPKVVKANCDISHLHLMRIEPREVRRLEGRIAHVHLSDCDGKVHGDLPPGRGVVPIIEYLEQIRDTGFDRTVSIELEYSPDPEKIVEWVEEAYGKTAEMMERLGCQRGAKSPQTA